MRCGLYGGAFDPPHVGHVAMAHAFAKQCQLDRLYIMPTGQAWHKATALSSAEHRLAMCRLAFGPVRGALVSDLELNRSGPTYTIETLEALVLQHPDATWCVLMGQDQWQRFTTWHRWQAIADIATLVVADRIGIISGKPFSEDLSDDHSVHRGLSALPLQWQPVAVSSTELRAQAALFSGVDAGSGHLLPTPVARYISQHQLYPNTHV